MNPGDPSLKYSTVQADFYTLQQQRRTHQVEVSPEGPVTTRIKLDLKEAEKGNSRFVLHQDDYLFVRTVPDWNIYRSANITGRVLYPGNYAVKRGESFHPCLKGPEATPTTPSPAAPYCSGRASESNSRSR